MLSQLTVAEADVFDWRRRAMMDRVWFGKVSGGGFDPRVWSDGRVDVMEIERRESMSTFNNQCSSNKQVVEYPDILHSNERRDDGRVGA